jgi:hypothetical protein
LPNLNPDPKWAGEFKYHSVIGKHVDPITIIVSLASTQNDHVPQHLLIAAKGRDSE